MKKLLLLSAMLCSMMGTVLAQSSIEFIPMGGYTFGDKLQFNNSFGQVSTAWNYGGSIQFNLNRHFGIEVMYNRMDVTAKMYNYGAFPGDAPIYQTNAGINYIMVGPNANFPLPNSPVSLFLGASLGAAIFSPAPQDFSSNAKFAYGAQAGANIYITPQFGIRLSGRLLGTAPADGYYFGQWGEPGSGGGFYNSNPGLVQFGFNVGFIVGLGRVLPADQKTQRATRHARPPRKYYYYN